MLCKYCKSTDHVIDDCKEIVCKNCKKHGHVHWKCVYNKNNDIKIQKKEKKEKKEKNEKKNKRNIRDNEYLIHKRLRKYISNIFEIYDLGGTIPIEIRNDVWNSEIENNDWQVEEMTKWGLIIEKILNDLKKNY